jgi:chromosomal replication initiation ATPase DnaA
MDKRLIKIKNTVCKVLKFDSSEFNKESREQHIVDARHYYHYLCKEFTFIKLKEIIELSGVTHSSVYHSYHTMNKWLVNDEDVQKNVERMKYLLRDKLFNMQF